MALKRKLSIARRVRGIGKLANDHREWTAVWGAWLILQALTLLDHAISVPMLYSIYHFFGQFMPPESSSSVWLPLWKLGYIQLMFWPIIGFIYLLVKLIEFRRTKQPIVAMNPIVLYEKEAAATLLAIDNAKDTPNNHMAQVAMRERIADLLNELAETVAVNLGLKKKDYRLYLVVQSPNDKKRGMLSGYRIGRIFENAANGKTSEADFQAILDKDMARVDTFLTEYDTAVCFTKLDGDEKAVLMMARNPGRYLKMGLYLAVTKPGTEIEDFKDTFVEVTGIISTLGFIDEIVDYVRKCGKGGDDTRG